jgi:hypothetical protein
LVALAEPLNTRLREQWWRWGKKEGGREGVWEGKKNVREERRATAAFEEVDCKESKKDQCPLSGSAHPSSLPPSLPPSFPPFQPFLPAKLL